MINSQSHDEFAIPGRCLFATGEEHACSATQTTLRSADISVRIRPESGEPVILYLEHVGMLFGQVTSVQSQGFKAALKVPESRRSIVASRLEWHRDRAREAQERRVCPRIVPIKRDVEVKLSEGLVFQASILNISTSGVAVSVHPSCRPFPESVVMIGRRYATVVRHLDNGFAAEFKTPIPGDTFDERVLL